MRLTSVILVALVVAAAGCVSDDSRVATATTTSTLEPAMPKVDFEVYIDFECPYSRGSAGMVKKIREKHADEINFMVRHFPLNTHPGAWIAAEASECARDQGKFLEYHDMLFNSTGDLASLDFLDELAFDAGLDVDEFDDCIDSGVKKDIVLEDKRRGLEKGVRSTPTFIIGGQWIRGVVNIEAYELTIENELAGLNQANNTVTQERV